MKLINDIVKIITTEELRGYLLQGFLNTLIVTVCAAAIGLVLGVIIAIIKVFAKENKYLTIPAKICDIYTTIVRGTPVALQLFLMVFAILAIPGFKVTAVIITFGLNSSAYVSENIRAGILSVDKGQMEAGRSLGLTKLKTMIKIVFPQAIKNSLPSIGNEFIVNIKDTSVLTLIGVLDLFSVAKNDILGIFSAKSLEAYLIVAVYYLVLTYITSKLLQYFEKKMDMPVKGITSSN